MSGIQLLPHQQRVLDEHTELQGRLEKLSTFMGAPLYMGLPAEERHLLALQHGLMHQLVNVLARRILLFKGMRSFTCHKQVLARPMTRGDYNALRGWQVPAGENPADEGYLVEYPDSDSPNHPDFKHYISWSPKDVFDRGYKETQ